LSKKSLYGILATDFHLYKTELMKWSYSYISLTICITATALFLSLCILQTSLSLPLGIPANIALLGSVCTALLLVAVGNAQLLILVGKLHTDPYELSCIRNGSFLVYEEPANHIKGAGSYHWFSDPLNKKRRLIIAVEGSFVSGTAYEKTPTGLTPSHKTVAQLYLSLTCPDRPDVVDV
jgi:hypothetical protein